MWRLPYWSLRSSETHAVNPQTLRSSKSCGNHDTLSQFCLKVLSGCQSQSEINSRSHPPGRTLRPHPLHPTPTPTLSCPPGQELSQGRRAGAGPRHLCPTRTSIHERPASGSGPCLPVPGVGDVCSWCFLKFSCFVSVSFPPWYHGKDLLIATLWVAVSKV
ncbi:unnamed protein product [Pipistrellus nathusii]|uniref:Uncharacterized protein n=1 Tax=Pipistrellus nathusii TaxID=59473 RepID=A0ABN9ZR26_PIPNA